MTNEQIIGLIKLGLCAVVIIGAFGPMIGGGLMLGMVYLAEWTSK